MQYEVNTRKLRQEAEEISGNRKQLDKAAAILDPYSGLRDCAEQLVKLAIDIDALGRGLAKRADLYSSTETSAENMSCENFWNIPRREDSGLYNMQPISNGLSEESMFTGTIADIEGTVNNEGSHEEISSIIKLR